MQGSPAEARILAARRLIDRRRYREALEVLNDAIRIDPGKSDSFQLRAVVFEYLGMFPQAEADRGRAADLGYVETEELPRTVIEEQEPDAPPPEPAPVRPAEPVVDEVPASEVPVEGADPEESEREPEVADEVIEEPDSVEPETGDQRTPRVAPIPRYAMRPASRGDGTGGTFARGFGTVLVTVGLVAAFSVGVYLAVANITDALDGGGGDGGGGSPTPVASGDVSPTATTAAPDDALTGSPLSFSNLATGWESKGITATPGDINTEITGFAVEPVNVTLTQGGEEMLVAVLLYDSAGGISQDWDLGDRPTPKAGREIPLDSTVWYNLNAVVIVLESNDALRQDALDGFLSVNA